MESRRQPVLKNGRIIIHFDYDCFYASVFEAKNPALRSLPFAVQQKQIIVTCNYVARSRGLYKLQLIRDAKRICPDVIIELGEDISRFRDASKELYGFIKSYCWGGRIEKLGFDEVWVDVTDMVGFNMDLINRNDLANSFFQLSREDPMNGFAFDATDIAGHPYPKGYQKRDDDALTLRLRLGSHLALYLRHQLEQQKGYTCTVGIATSKLLSKLVGNLNKPKGQTTLLPPLDLTDESNNVTAFMDGHEIGKVPGIGFKLAQKLREFILQRPADFDAGLVYGGTKEKVTVADVRTHADVNPEMLEKLLGGPGSPHGIGYKVWCLVHGVDDTEVNQAKPVPSQISIEDSYIRLDHMNEVIRELTTLSKSLLTRMRIDLLGDPEDDDTPIPPKTDSEPVQQHYSSKKWLAHPKTLRLTTRPRQPLQPDGTRIRSFKRISHSAPLPTSVFNMSEHVDALAEKLVRETLVGMFRRLHPQSHGWNLSLVNLAVTNMAETAGTSRTAHGRDIGTMFRRQDEVLRDFRVVDAGSAEEEEGKGMGEKEGSIVPRSKDEVSEIMDDEEGEERVGWEEDDGDGEEVERCGMCGMKVPGFAMGAHLRFHTESKVVES